MPWGGSRTVPAASPPDCSAWQARGWSVSQPSSCFVTTPLWRTRRVLSSKKARDDALKRLSHGHGSLFVAAPWACGHIRISLQPNQHTPCPFSAFPDCVSPVASLEFDDRNGLTG